MMQVQRNRRRSARHFTSPRSAPTYPWQAPRRRPRRPLHITNQRL